MSPWPRLLTSSTHRWNCEPKFAFSGRKLTALNLVSCASDAKLAQAMASATAEKRKLLSNVISILVGPTLDFALRRRAFANGIGVVLRSIRGAATASRLGSLRELMLHLACDRHVPAFGERPAGGAAVRSRHL